MGQSHAHVQLTFLCLGPSSILSLSLPFSCFLFHGSFILSAANMLSLYEGEDEDQKSQIISSQLSHSCRRRNSFSDNSKPVHPDWSCWSLIPKLLTCLTCQKNAVPMKDLEPLVIPGVDGPAGPLLVVLLEPPGMWMRELSPEKQIGFFNLCLLHHVS